MKGRLRRPCAILLFMVLILSTLSGPPVRAATQSGVYFTAANEQLMPLNDETMPFYSNDVLYVSSRLFEGGELGISYSRHTALGLATLYMHGSTKDLRFDMAGQIAYDKEGNLYSGYAIERGGIVFFPLRLVCQYFGLTWSYSETDTVPLIRVKSGSAIFSDSDFIYVASRLMSDRYSEYSRSAPSNPSSPVESQDPPVQAAEGQRVYLLFDGAGARDILPSLEDVRATFLLTAEEMEDGDLLRALTAGGHAVALRIGSAESAREELLAAREALWQSARVQLELVWSGGLDLSDLLEELGCVEVRAGLEVPGEQAGELLRAIGRYRENLGVYLGGAECLPELPDVLRGLQEGGYLLGAWRLTA